MGSRSGGTKKAPPRWGGAFLVPVTGLEPVRCRQRWILSPEGHAESRVKRKSSAETGRSEKHCICNRFLEIHAYMPARSPPSIFCPIDRILVE